MPNYDEKTGIHYGVISPHSIMSEVLNDIYDRGTDPQYESAKEEITTDIKNVLDKYGFSIGQMDEVLSPVIDIFNESYESDGSGICDYEDQEYTLHVSGDNFGIFVIRSPYYTFTRQCSPCAPGAGDLDDPVSIGEYKDKPYPAFNNWNMYSYVKAYCLDKSYFEGEKVPYKVYRVDNDQEVV